MSSSQIIMLVMVEIIVMLGVGIGIVILLLRKARTQIDELRATLKLRKNENVDFERLITRELDRTKLRMQTLLGREKPDDEAIIATRLRASFLTAEKHAREYRENQEEFWQALENALKEMIALSRLKVAKTTGTEKDEWQKKLANSEQQVNELELLRGGYSASADLMRNAQEQACELLELRELKEQHVSKIEQLVREVTQLRTASSRAELPELDGGEKTALEPPASTPVVIKNVHDVEYIHSTIADTLQHIDSFQSNSSSEVKLLKDMCLEQRSIIKKLREQLKSGSENAASHSDPHTEAMERLLRDSDMCIRTLEQEVENLQSEINVLRDELCRSMENMAKLTTESAGGIFDIDTEARIGQYQEQNRRLRERIHDHEKQLKLSHQIRAYIVDSADCNSPNAVIESLATAMSNFGVQGYIQIKFAGKTLSAGIGGSIEGKDSNLLNSILVSQDVTAVGDDTILSLPPLKVLIKGGGGIKPPSINMASIREVAEAFARQLTILDQGERRRDQHNGKSQTIGVIKKSLTNIKVQWSYQEAEARQVTKSLVEDLSIALSMTELGDAAEKRLLTIVDESAKRLDVLFNSGKVLDKSITQLLNKIDESAP